MTAVAESATQRSFADYVTTLEASLESILCPVCNSAEHEPLFEGIALRNNRLRCVICRDCTHIFLNPRPTMEAFKDFYSAEAYFHLCAMYLTKPLEGTLSQYEDDAFWAERFTHGKLLYERYFKGILGKDDLVFDFGCGDGAWLWALKELTGCQVGGEEISEIYSRVASRRTGAEILYGPVEELSDEIIGAHRGRTKLAIVSGSLQHMLHPMECLRVAHEILSDDGYLFLCNWDIMTHYMTSYRDQELRRLLGEVLSWEHPHYFHEDSYKYMVRQAGFEIVDFEPDATIRERHMALLARKTTRPAVPPPLDHSAQDVIARVRALEAGTITGRLRQLP